MVMQSDFYHRWVTGQIDTKWYIIGLTFPAIFTGYGVLMEGFFGWTVGKWMLRLQVRRANQMGEKAGWPQVILRNVIKILELNFAPVLLVMGINRSHQRLGDMLAGTVVLQEQKRFDNYS